MVTTEAVGGDVIIETSHSTLQFIKRRPKIERGTGVSQPEGSREAQCFPRSLIRTDQPVELDLT